MFLMEDRFSRLIRGSYRTELAQSRTAVFLLKLYSFDLEHR